MKKNIFILFLLLNNHLKAEEKLTNYVDTQIGANVIRASNCVIGPQVPFGSINPSPQSTQLEKVKNTSGYVPGEPVMGFGQLHVSGTGGAGKYGHFLISPQVGKAFALKEHLSDLEVITSRCNYFKGKLERYNIDVEITPAHHCALYRLTYPKTADASIVIDMSHTIPRDILNRGGEILENTVKIDKASGRVYGMITFKGGWGASYPNTVYFVSEINRPDATMALWSDHDIVAGNEDSLSQNDDNPHKIGSCYSFSTQENNSVLMKVAVSFAGFEQAGQYLEKELKNCNFEQVAENTAALWEKELQKIKIDSESVEQKKIFYTAMYHSMVMPRDRTGDFLGFNPKSPFWDDHYAVWDTWRTVFPFYVLINPQVVSGVINSFIERWKVNGRVFDAFIGGKDYLEDQGGNNIDNIIADAYVKKVKGVNWKEAYDLLKYDAENERLGLPIGKFANENAYFNSYKTKGWVAKREDGWQCSSMTMEYAYNDFCVAQVAKGLKKDADYAKYIKRSENWKNLWDDNLTYMGYKGFIGAKDIDGNFSEFDVSKWGSRSWMFYEGSSWTYTYFVPQNFAELIRKMGGNEEYVKRLEFALKNDLIEYDNEPSFQTIRSFSNAGRPDLTSKWVHKLMKENYDLTGVTGNDDSGAMSTWYIFSALGFFPNAGQDIYYLNAPLYKKAEINLPNGKKFTVSATNISEENIYIKSCTLNGKAYNKSIIHHQDIMNGGTIAFELSPTPTDWGQTNNQ